MTIQSTLYSAPGDTRRVFLAAFAHETNSFSPVPATMRSFENDILYRPGDDAAAFQRAYDFPGYGYIVDIARDRQDHLTAGLCAWTQPSGPVARIVYETLRDDLLAQIRDALPLDMVVLVLHGAMLADGYPDCEGDLLARVRELVGPAVPIGALLDLHGNVTPAMVASGAVLIACKEYPHTDYRERVGELYSLLRASSPGGVRLETILRPVPMLGLFGTTEGPMKQFVESLRAAERIEGIASISAMHGFPWSDIEATGAAIVVVHDGTAPCVAADLAEQLARDLFALRTESLGKRLPLDEALDAALSACSAEGLVALADGADNPGGGAACDSTHLLAALLERDVKDTALGMLWDPQAALFAADAGVGARLPLRLGGKVGPASGQPVDVEAEVLCVRHDATQQGLAGPEPLGLAVALRVSGIDIVVNSIRQQVFSPECFEKLGIDLSRKRLVVVKSIQHFRALFDPITRQTVYCDAPGSLNLDFKRLPYRHLRRPMWPIDPLESLPVSLAGMR